VLEPWQRDEIIRPLFGWKRVRADLPRERWPRRYRTVYVEVPKKNGKSTLAAGLALYLLFADGEDGAEVYGAAGDKDQARIVFDLARDMRVASPELRKRSKAYKNSLVVHSTASTYKVLSADAPTKHGFNAHAIIFDELHVQPTRELWDTLTTGVAARRQPVTIALTTAGYDRHSICWEVHEYARKVRDGALKDPEFLAVIFAADGGDDWRAPSTWAKANPSLGVSVQPEYFQGQITKAEDSLAYQNTFKRLHLNLWTESLVRWLDADRWQACAAAVPMDDLLGRDCYAGLDLSTTTDITAYVLLFPPRTAEEPYVLVPHFWAPEASIRLRATRDRVPYDVWAQQGQLFKTEGNVVDYDVVRAFIRGSTGRFRIREIAYDRWNATQLVTQLLDDGAPMVPVGQGFQSLSAPTKEFEALVVSGRLRHGGHPVLTWMAGNVVIAKDPADNWKPTKQKSSGRIDGIVAAIMALGRAIVQADERPSDHYARHDLLVIG
jgi:phage terminase large subunit-like protein